MKLSWNIEKRSCLSFLSASCSVLLLVSYSALCLHVFLQALLKDPLYIGLRHKRVRGQAYDDLLDEFMKAVSDRYDHIGLEFLVCPLPLCCLLSSF